MLFFRKSSSDFQPTIYHPLYLIRSGLAKGIEELAPLLTGRVVDFGCGLKPYRNLFRCDEYIGVDYHGQGETYSHQFVDVFYDGKVIPFADESVDGVFTSEVFEHVFNLEEIIIELKRILRKGGRMLLTCPFTFPEHEVPQDFARYTSYALKNLLEAKGFKIIEQRKAGSHYYAVTQLRIVCIDAVILSRLNHIPILRTIVRKSVYSTLNVCAIISTRLLPNYSNLYLSNIIVAEKI